MANILIKNGLIVDTEWTRHSDIYIENSKIRRIAKDIKLEELPEDVSIVHADGLCILPGLVDASPLLSTDLSYDEECRVSAFGGFTTLIGNASDNKKDLTSSVISRRGELTGMSLDYSLAPEIGEYRANLEEELKQIRKMGIKAIKLFVNKKNSSFLKESREDVIKVMELCKKYGFLVSLDTDDRSEKEIGEGAIDSFAELSMALEMETYISTITTTRELEKVREWRNKGARLSICASPSSIFSEDNPALKEALAEGEIQVVASTSLSSDGKKTVLTSAEELIPLMHTFGLLSGRVGLSQIVNMLSTKPAKLFGLYPKKGILQEGSDADLIVFDPEESWTLSKDTLHSTTEGEENLGKSVTGKVIMTYLRGRLVMGDEIYLGLKGDGRFVGENHD